MATVAQTIYDALIQAGATPTEAAAIMGNMVQESSLNPEEQVMDSNGAMSRGLVMWNDKGAGSGVNWGQYITGNVTQDIINQVQLLKSQGAFQDAAGATVQEAAMNFVNNFERPDPAYANYSNRVDSAVTISQVAQSGGWSGLDWGTESATGTGTVPTAAGAAADTGGIVSQTGGTSSVQGMPLTAADIPTIVAWIQQNWPSYAWLMNEPGLASILENAAVQGLSTDQVQALIEQSAWWKTTSNAMRNYEQDKATNPADYSFNTPGSKASQMYAQIANAAASYGVQLTPDQIQELANQALQFGWTTQQIQQAIGKGATPQNAQQVTQQINSMANQYYQTLSPQMQGLWTQQVAEGTRTLQEFQAQMASQAAQKWTGYSQQLLNGYTMQQLTDNMRQEAAKTMEVDPNSINFTTDPTYQKILDYVPPSTNPKVSEPHRVMTLSEMDQYLKGLPAYGYTQNARDQTANLEQTLAQDLGKIPGAQI